MRFSAVRAARQIVQDMSFNVARAARNTAPLRPGPPPRSLPSCYVARVRDDSANRRFLRGLGRAFAGAILFGLPLLMTMEMWWLGFTLPAPRLAVLLVVLFPVLVLLSWHAGFEPTFSWKNDVVDALVAYAVGFVASAAVLGLLGLVDRTMEAREVIGKIALQAVPASIGALLSQSQIGEQKAEGGQHGSAGYLSDLFIMGVGAVFFALNVAPTEEMLVIALRVAPALAIVVVLVTAGVMHAFGHAAAGARDNDRPRPHWFLFLRFTLAGYALAVFLSAAMLWFFGRLDGLGIDAAVKAIAVLSLPAGIGAASARLVL